MISNDGTTHPDLTGAARNDRVSQGQTHTVQTNPVQRTGRPDGTSVAELMDPDGFEAEDSTVAGTRLTGQTANGDPSVQRAGRQEVSGLTTLGYPSDERGFTPPTTNVTSSGGGKISSV